MEESNMNENHSEYLGGFGLVVGALLGAGLWAAIVFAIIKLI